MLLCREKEKHQLAGDKHGRQWQEKKDNIFFLPFFPFFRVQESSRVNFILSLLDGMATIEKEW